MNINAFFSSCGECPSKQTAIDALQAELERYKVQEAQQLVLRNRDPEAADIFRDLAARREAEKQRAIASGDAIRAAAAEYTGLSIQQELARVLTRQRNFGDAESIMRNVCMRRRYLMPNDLPAIRSAQLDLCVILTAQENNTKRREAKMLYRSEWYLHEDNTPSGALAADHTWIVKNGHLLGMLLHRTGAHEEALLILRQVLAYCPNPSEQTNEIIGTLVSYLLDSARSDEEHPQNSAALAKRDEVRQIILQRYLQPNSHIEPAHLESVIAVARIIDHKQAQVIAEPLRRHIHTENIRIYTAQSPQAFKSGWALASSLTAQGKAGEARPIVDGLLRAKRQEFDRSEAVRMLRTFLNQSGPDRERHSEPMDRERGTAVRCNQSGGLAPARRPSDQGERRVVRFGGTSPPTIQISPRLGRLLFRTLT